MKINSKIIKDVQKHREIRTMQNGLDNIAKYSKPMNETEFKHAIGL